MHAVVIVFLTILELLARGSANPCLQQTWQYEAVSTDLQQLLLSYQRRHIHVMLYDMEVDIHGAPSPYVLTRMEENHLHNRFLKVGGLALPQMRHLLDHCQASFQVLLSKKRSYELARPDSPAVRPDEGDSARYRLKHRFSFLMVTYSAPFWDETAVAEAGGNLFVILTYGFKGWSESKTAYSSLESATVICEHCFQREKSLKCATVSQCLCLVSQVHEEMENKGWTAKWVIFGNYPEGCSVERCNSRSFYCIRPEYAKTGQCTWSLKDAMLNYITGSLNESMVGYSNLYTSRLHGAMISWSDDTTALEIIVPLYLLPFNLYPMRSPNESLTSLKFITADGVNPRIPYLEVYSQPFDLGTWVTGLGLFLILITLVTVATKSDIPRADACCIMQWSLFWVYGTLLDQVNFPPFRKARTGFRSVINSLLVTSVVLAFVLNNVYRAILNVNYVTGNELLCPWSRLDQLINFSVLYIPTSACLWKQMEALSSEMSKEKVTLQMYGSCYDEKGGITAERK